jgi:hypothetical protein
MRHAPVGSAVLVVFDPGVAPDEVEVRLAADEARLEPLGRVVLAALPVAASVVELEVPAV